MTFELVILFAILTTLGLAVYAGRRVFVALIALVGDYRALMQTQRETLQQIAEVNTTSFKQLCAAHATAMSQTVDAHSSVLHDVASSHSVGSVALAAASQQLNESAALTLDAAKHIAATANMITEALGSSFLGDIMQELKTLRKFVVPSGN